MGEQRRIDDCRASFILGIGVNPRQQVFLKCHHLLVDRFSKVAIAIIVYGAICDTDFPRTSRAFMASAALPKTNGCGVLIVAACAALHFLSVHKAPVVFLAFKLVGTLYFCAEQRCACCEVVDIAEGQRLGDLIIADFCIGDSAVDAHRRFASLVAVQAEVVHIPLTEGDLSAAGEGDLSHFIDGEFWDCVMAGGASH